MAFSETTSVEDHDVLVEGSADFIPAEPLLELDSVYMPRSRRLRVGHVQSHRDLTSTLVHAVESFHSEENCVNES